MIQKISYVCGPLTELDPETMVKTKSFYEQIGDALGFRAFVPHEHYDPITAAHFTPQEVDEAERKQVCTRTSLLIVCPIAPSWGGGIEVEMAHRSDVPVILLCDRKKLEARMISRLLRGNPAVRSVITYDDHNDGILKLKEQIPAFHQVPVGAS